MSSQYALLTVKWFECVPEALLNSPWHLTGSERLLKLWFVDICLGYIASIHLVFEAISA